MAMREEDSKLITRVEGDAPLGAMFRRYWWPALWSEEVAERDGTPVRIRLLGQNFVAFRDTNGEVGIVDAACPHRLASLALGRNEDGGLRCIYHGWKFDVRGRCVEMPTEPAGYAFADRIRLGSYPVRDAGGLIWVYLGPKELEPAFPAFDWTQIPRNQIGHLKFLENVNYLQAAEGAIDSAHTRFLHRGTIDPVEEKKRNALSLDLAPKLEVADTTYGFRYVALRKPNVDADKFRYVKITRYVFPAAAVTARNLDREHPALTQMFVPVDDTHTMHYTIWHSMDGRPVDEAKWRADYHLVPGVDTDANWRPIRHADNFWQQDRERMKSGDWTGITGLMIQDAACQESMGPITDHSRERLGTSDVAIIRLRKRMLESVRGFIAGKAPVGLEFDADYGRLCSIQQDAFDVNVRWEDVETFPGEYEPVRSAHAVPAG